MPTVKDLVYRINPPAGKTVDEVLAAFVPAAKDMMVNKWIVGMDIDIYEDHLLFTMRMRGHDLWWIKRRSPKIVIALLIRAELEVSDAELVEIKNVVNLKSARFWTVGYNKGKRVFMPIDGSDPPPPRQWKCKNCPPPAMMHQTRSGWHQTY